mmetsp:Transcript_35470/g.82136  ORF Transcript_35470/g.82136 Transcript_35470/m.82136 type:complete len:779 (-) Transcript_35470:104-2440(-)
MGASSSKVGSTDSISRDASLRDASLLRGLVGTAVEMKYPMWLVPVSSFVKLAKLEPHQVMRERGELVMWDPSMKTVFFLSHQWTSFEHPDHTLDQLRCFKRLLVRMMKGEVANTVPDFAAQSYLPKGIKVTTKEWQTMVSDAYIWMDYMSVPQIGTYLDAEVSDLMKAVESIPAYVEKASHFFAVTPTVTHADLPSVTCNYGSWLKRGWCRLEMISLLLSRFNDMPVIVVTGPECQPFMISPTTIMARPPGGGELTCCARNHKIRNLDATTRKIPCDRAKIGPVVWTLLKSKLEYVGRPDGDGGSLEMYRIWTSLMPHLMRNLPVPDEYRSYVPSTVEEFLRLYRFETANDEEGKEESGLSPLFMAAFSGNVKVARVLVAEHKANASVQARDQNTILGLDVGCTPLHGCTAFAATGHEEMITLLLNSGADLNAQSKLGITPLAGASILQNPEGSQALLGEIAAKNFDLETGRLVVNNATPLSVAAYLGTTEFVEALVKAGADRTALSDHGSTMLHSACQNPEADHRMLDLLFGTDSKIDVNAVYRPLTRKWYGIDILFETMARCGDRSAFTMDMAHTRGSTALHVAAVHGQSHLVEWLLQHGAKDSLSIKNKMGATPLEMARIFGPHPEIENLLSAALLEADFVSKYKVRDGRSVRMSGFMESTVGLEEDDRAAEEAISGSVAAAAIGHSEVLGDLAVESLEDETGDQRQTQAAVSLTPRKLHELTEFAKLQQNHIKELEQAVSVAVAMANSNLPDGKEIFQPALPKAPSEPGWLAEA